MTSPPDAASAERAWRARRRQILSTTLLVAGLVGIALAAREALDDSGGVTLPGPIPLVAATAATRVGLWCAGRAWVGLIGPGADRHRLLAAIYQSQLTKYLPAGGLIQAAGQVGLTALQGVTVRRASMAFLALTSATVAAGLTIGAWLSLVTALPGWVRVLALAGVTAPLLVHRPVLGAVVSLARRISSRVPPAEELPDERALRGAFAWCLGTHLLYASGFAVLLEAVHADPPWLAVMVGYVVSWVAGFLVVPLPSGVGVREVVLVAVVPGIGAGPLLAASLAQRLVTIAAELLAALGNRLWRPFRLRRAQADGPARRS